MRLGIVRLYFGESGKKGFYNSQEIGLARAMKKIGYEIYIFIPNPNITIIEEESEEEGIKVIYVPAKTVGVHSRFYWKVLENYKIDVVQLEADNQIFAPDIISYCDKNHILLYLYIGVTESDTNCKTKKFLFDILFRRNIRSYKSHMCFAKTPSVNKQLNTLGIYHTELAPVGLDIEVIPQIDDSKLELRNMLGLPINKTIILYVGRMDEYKRPLEAINLIEELNDNYYLIMIGEGSLYYNIKDEILKKNIANRVIQIRQIPNKDIHKYYISSDYLLNFNSKEIFGMSILEAMYQGCTVLAYHASGPDYIIENGISGYLCNDITEMKHIIESNTMLNKEKIKSRIVENFAWKKTAAIFDRWIKQNYK